MDSDDQTQRERKRFPVFPTPSRSSFPVAYEDLGYIGRDYEDELTNIECAAIEAGLPFGFSKEGTKCDQCHRTIAGGDCIRKSVASVGGKPFVRTQNIHLGNQPRDCELGVRNSVISCTWD